MLVNGCTTDWFSPSTSIRQEDPLFPYIFVLYAQGFSSRLQKLQSSSIIQGLKTGRNHLIFANDYLVCFRQTMTVVQALN